MDARRAQLSAGFAVGVRALRETAGRPSIRAISEAAGLSEGTVCDALSGRRRPSRRVVVALAVVLGGDPQVWGLRWDELDTAWRAVPGVRWSRPPGEDPDRCQVPGCPNKAQGRYCGTHDRHLRLYGDPAAGPFRTTQHPDTCQVPDCGRPYSAKGLCRVHYVRAQRAARARTRGGSREVDD